jgi:hypothetical protein
MSSAIVSEFTQSMQLVATKQCSHLNGAGRRCRMLIAPTHDTLCAHHLQQQLADQPDPEILAAELLDGTGNLDTAERVNTLLANVTRQFARGRIDRRDALALGYLAQLLLNTVRGVHKEHQAIRAHADPEARHQRFAAAQAARLRAAPPV